MGTPPGENSLELDTDMRLQRIMWKIQRVTWVLAFLVLALIALGITGDGPLAYTERAREDVGLEVHYARFARETAPTTVRLVVSPSPESSETRIWLSQSLLDQYQVEQITPQPDSSTLDNDRLILTFPFESSTAEAEIFVQLRPRSLGSLDFEIGQIGGPEFEISQIVYP